MPSEARLKNFRIGIMKNSKIRKKLYAEWSETKKYRKIKEGPKKLNFGASKPGVGGPRPQGPPGSTPAHGSMGVPPGCIPSLL